MCLKCEMKGITMALRPLDLALAKDSVSLPDSWKQLEDAGFHPDLLERAYAHLAWTDRIGNPTWIGNARAFLSSLGKGYSAQFDRSSFEPRQDDPYVDLKRRALDALIELATEFGNRVPSVMWNSLAHLACRNEPEEKHSILKEAGALPHHYGIVDTMLHAMGKVYTFALHVQSVFFRHTDMVLVHNCDCNCSLLNLRKSDGGIVFRLNETERFEATQSLMSHMCAESHLILNDMLPFEYTITGDAQALLGVDMV